MCNWENTDIKIRTYRVEMRLIDRKLGYIINISDYLSLKYLRCERFMSP